MGFIPSNPTSSIKKDESPGRSVKKSFVSSSSFTLTILILPHAWHLIRLLLPCLTSVTVTGDLQRGQGMEVKFDCSFCCFCNIASLFLYEHFSLQQAYKLSHKIRMYVKFGNKKAVPKGRTAFVAFFLTVICHFQKN